LEFIPPAPTAVGTPLRVRATFALQKTGTPLLNPLVNVKPAGNVARIRLSVGTSPVARVYVSVMLEFTFTTGFPTLSPTPVSVAASAADDRTLKPRTRLKANREAQCVAMFGLLIEDVPPQLELSAAGRFISGYLSPTRRSRCMIVLEKARQSL